VATESSWEPLWDMFSENTTFESGGEITFGLDLLTMRL
jgi:hypothetical protein